MKNIKDDQTEKLKKEERALEESLIISNSNKLSSNLSDIQIEINKFDLEENIKNAKALQLKNKLFNFGRFFFRNDTNRIISDIDNCNCIENNKATGFSNNFVYVGQFGKYDGLDCPFGIIVDKGLIYVTDSGNNRIVVYNLEKTKVNEFDLPFKPSCITLNKNSDNLIVGSCRERVIYKFSKDRTLTCQQVFC